MKEIKQIREKKTKQNRETKHFQEYMPIFRKAVGWTAEDLANSIEIDKQIINNLESVPPRTILSNERYIAIRTVLEKEIKNRPKETKMLQNLLNVCVDKYGDFTEQERQAVIEKAKTMVPAIVSKESDKEMINLLWIETIIPKVLGIAAIALLNKYTKFGWLDIIGTKTNKK